MKAAEFVLTRPVTLDQLDLIFNRHLIFDMTRYFLRHRVIGLRCRQDGRILAGVSNILGDVATQWRKWVNRFTNHMTGLDIEEDIL